MHGERSHGPGFLHSLSRNSSESCPSCIIGLNNLPLTMQSWQQRSAELQTEAAAASEAAEAAKAAAAKLRKDQENERERVKKVMGDMKKKLDRCPPPETWMHL